MIKERLRDPESARIRPLGVRAEGSEWIYWFEVNAKNAFGGYTGYKRYGLILRDGEHVGTVGFSQLVDSEGLLPIDAISWHDDAERRYWEE